MWSEMKKVLKDCATENNGTSYCAFRVAALSMLSTGFPTFLACTVYSVFHSHNFDMMAFGTAFAAMLSGTAVLAGGVAVKARTETA